MNSPDLFREEYTIDTPENVTFGYEVAGIGNRFVAALIDTLMLVVLLGLLNILVVVMVSVVESSGILLGIDEPSWGGGLLLALYALLNFTLIWGYYLLFELLWNGQSPGKRAVKIRVVQVEGVPAGFIEIAIRNLVRVVDFLPFGYGVGLVTMFLNRRSRRLGDFAANTLVIKDQGGLSLETLTSLSTLSALPDPLDAATVDPPAPVETTSSATRETAEQPFLKTGEGAAVHSRMDDSDTDTLAGSDDVVADEAKVEYDVPEESLLEQYQPEEIPGIHRLRREEYELIVESLARYNAGNLNPALINRLAAMTATRLDLPVPNQNGADSHELLSRIARAYRH